MTTQRSCSWCHELNDVTAAALRGDPVFCARCGHRADLPRMNCDCATCAAHEREADDEGRAAAAPAPWSLKHDYRGRLTLLVDEAGRSRAIACATADDGEATARRLLAAVNACRGLPDAAVELLAETSVLGRLANAGVPWLVALEDVLGRLRAEGGDRGPT